GTAPTPDARRTRKRSSVAALRSRLPERRGRARGDLTVAEELLATLEGFRVGRIALEEHLHVAHREIGRTGLTDVELDEPLAPLDDERFGGRRVLERLLDQGAGEGVPLRRAAVLLERVEELRVLRHEDDQLFAGGFGERRLRRQLEHAVQHLR